VTAEVLLQLRKTVQGVGPDRYLSPELIAANEFVASYDWNKALN
jgi:hypothetical protein